MHLYSFGRDFPAAHRHKRCKRVLKSFPRVYYSEPFHDVPPHLVDRASCLVYLLLQLSARFIRAD